jgi:hypothetical protein
MFEEIEVITRDQAPVEFTFRGRRFRIHAVLSRWNESGGWWKRLTSSSTAHDPIDDAPRAFFTVEAAPLGALATFQLERNDTTGEWEVRSL